MGVVGFHLRLLINGEKIQTAAGYNNMEVAGLLATSKVAQLVVNHLTGRLDI